jgi:hypothetical protein
MAKMKLNKEIILSLIDSENYHHFEDTTTVSCLLTLKNGAQVLGKAACIEPENFKLEVGMDVAKNDAISKIWELEGYAIKTRGA